MSVETNKLQEQIPLYINGTLYGEQRDSFEQSLQRNWELKQEYTEFYEINSVFEMVDNIDDQHFDRLFARIQANVKFDPSLTQPTVPAAPSLDQESTVIMRREEGIDKARAKYDKASTASRQETAKPYHNESIAENKRQPNKPALDEREDEHLSVFSKEFFSDFVTSARFAWGLVIAQFILIGTLMFSASGTGITAIGKDGLPLSNVATINVVFADNATQKQIRELLAGIDAQIANGPTDIGLYTIYVKGNQTDAKNIINRLKKSTLILLAEPAFI
jgi:hypothetical protein